MVDEWVDVQHRTMARWVSSKVPQDVVDLTIDLSDGLVLIRLVNQLIEESAVAGYVLTPVYLRPNFTLQKIENVDDILKFCRLVLKVNTCNISAEDVVGGNLKLILGLIWTLFVFLVSRLSAILNDSRSIGDIKLILLKWINHIGRTRALPQVSNFNKDWSLQQDKRPDLIFACILDFYSRDIIMYNDYVAGRKYANLESLIAIAKSRLGIADLAEVQDFNVLIPDEKCVVLYLIQWYMFFEKENEEPSSLQPEVCLNSNEGQFMSFIDHVLAAFKHKNNFETKALRLLNQITFNLSKLGRITHAAEKFQQQNTLVLSINELCAIIKSDDAADTQISKGKDCTGVVTQFKTLLSLLEEFKLFKTQVQPILLNHDFPEVHELFRATNFKLKSCGIFQGYEPFKQLSLSILLKKFDSLESLENSLAATFASIINALNSSNLNNIDSNIVYLLENLRARGKLICEATTKYAESLERLRQCKEQLQPYEEFMRHKHSVSELKALVVSIDTLEIPLTPETPPYSEFSMFKDCVTNLKNQKNMTFHDLKQFFKNSLSVSGMESPSVREFMKLIPKRRLLTLSESDDFTGILTLDESDNPHNIFDRVLQTLEYKLSGTHNRLYDLNMFVEQLENGFCIHN